MMRECIICYDEFDEFVTLPCNHELCPECHFKVLEISAQCPLCATKLTQLEKPPLRIQQQVEVHLNHRPNPLQCDSCCRCLCCMFALSVTFGLMYAITNNHK